jgi:hypothetical protein
MKNRKKSKQDMITTPKENKYNYKIKQEKGNISGSNKIL